MESEKVKEIKELLRCMNGEKACTNCHINDIAQEQETCCINVVADMTLDLINELESENERLSKELDSEWKDRRKAEEDLHKAEWNYKIGLSQSRKRNKELKDRIAELEKENTELKVDLKNSIDMQKKMLDGFKTATKEVEENLAREIPNLLKQFAEMLKAKMPCEEVFKGIWDKIDETLKEFIDE